MTVFLEKLMDYKQINDNKNYNYCNKLFFTITNLSVTKPNNYD
jgi:hypothetical protein